MTQDEALSILQTGANVFLTGEPGSGKTYTLNAYIAHVRSRGVEVAVTASTGIAATHIGGRTIHSWSGIGIKSELSDADLRRMKANKDLVRRIKKTRVLVIDEVSMLSADTLAMIEAVCRTLREDPRPFGGMQAVLVGDFFQLPPVSKSVRTDEGRMLIEETGGPGFAFESRAWQALAPRVCYLREQHRQEDGHFLALLSAIRTASVEEEHRELLRTRYRKTPAGNMTQLYAHNADVDRMNAAHLARLPGRERVYNMESRGPEQFAAALKRGCLSPERLLLKEGARVMFTKNDVGRHRYVNGTLGVVRGFRKHDGLPLVRLTSGETVCAEPAEWRMEDGERVRARITQVPVRLAWAITVHKSQGVSLDAAHMDLSGVFEYGQGYVALSRVRTLKGLSLSGLCERALAVHPDVQMKDEEFRNESEKTRAEFSALSSGQLREMHDEFLRAAGGTRVPGKRAGPSLRTQAHRTPTHEATRELLLTGLSIPEIARRRGRAPGTILSHIETLVEKGAVDPARHIPHLKPDPARFRAMKDAFASTRSGNGRPFLTPARRRLGGGYTFEELRLARLFI